jgi:hypothetical protein
MLNIISGSHLDHALTMQHLRFILATFGNRDGFFAETVAMPPELPPLPCGLRGPAVGGDPVPDAHVQMVCRPGRTYPSRVILPAFMPEHIWNLESRVLTVIAGPVGDLPCVLFTAYGGPLAPREPGDPSLPEDQREASIEFWKTHALAHT